MNRDGSQNRDSSDARSENELGESSGFTPSDVAVRIFGANPGGIEAGESRESSTKAQRQIILAAGLLPTLAFPSTPDAKGTEHVVRFCGKRVEKHQHSEGWMPVLDNNGMLPWRKQPQWNTCAGWICKTNFLET